MRNLGAHDALAQIGLAGCWLDRHIPSLSRVIYALHRQVCQAAVSCRIRLGQPGRNPQKAKRRGPIREPRLSQNALAAHAELTNQLLIRAFIFVLHIVQKPAALPNHNQQATARVEVLFMGLQMFGQIVKGLCPDDQ